MDKEFEEEIERQLEKALIFGEELPLTDEIINSEVIEYEFDGEGLGKMRLQHLIDCNMFSVGQEFSDGIEFTAYLPKYIRTIEDAFDFIQRIDWAAVRGSDQSWQLTTIAITRFEQFS